MSDVQYYARQLRAHASSATINDFVRVDLGAARKIADALSRLADTETRAVRMEAALTAARDKFAEYCSLHLEKGTPEATAKAMTNRRMASMCATALAADPSALAQAIEGVLADDDLYKAALRRHQSEEVADDLCGRLDALRRAWGQR